LLIEILSSSEVTDSGDSPISASATTNNLPPEDSQALPLSAMAESRHHLIELEKGFSEKFYIIKKPSAEGQRVYCTTLTNCYPSHAPQMGQSWTTSDNML